MAVHREELVAAVQNVAADVDPRPVIEIDPFHPLKVVHLGALSSENSALPDGRGRIRKAHVTTVGNRTHARKN